MTASCPGTCKFVVRQMEVGSHPTKNRKPTLRASRSQKSSTLVKYLLPFHCLQPKRRKSSMAQLGVSSESFKFAITSRHKAHLLLNNFRYEVTPFMPLNVPSINFNWPRLSLWYMFTV